MDIFQRLTQRIGMLPAGPAKTGLNAVKLHVGTAINHLHRGEVQNDETAFTDAILRCNHAFEGSVKEAYRVLANSDPSHKTPASIEVFLKDGEVLRPKVLDQFEKYRKEWRNPSTHDYLLDFDANEALLAIVSVTVFAVVLCDQIRGKLAYVAAQTHGEHPLKVEEEALPWLEQVKAAVRRFAIEVQSGAFDNVSFDDGFTVDEAIAGYLAAEWSDRPDVIVEDFVTVDLSGDRSTTADVLIRSQHGGVAVETRDRAALLDETRLSKFHNFANGLLASKDVEGVVVLFIDTAFDYTKTEAAADDISGKILVVG